MDNTKRFSSKAEGYARYRPTYPENFFDYLVNQVGFSALSIVADVGAGTGIFSKQLSAKVQTIYAVEPNDNMRAELVRHCRENDNILPTEGSAEATSLPEQSIDFITAAQAFHWFDLEKTKTEFLRIARSDSKVVLVWNTNNESHDFIGEYNEISRKFCPDFRERKHAEDLGAYRQFFRNGEYEKRVFSNSLLLSWESYIGMTLSTSYSLDAEHDHYKAYIDSLQNLFHKYASDGKLLIPNNTYSYVGEV